MLLKLRVKRVGPLSINYIVFLRCKLISSIFVKVTNSETISAIGFYLQTNLFGVASVKIITQKQTFAGNVPIMAEEKLSEVYS
jgi:hypothetical protein